jgi:MFS family permease
MVTRSAADRQAWILLGVLTLLALTVGGFCVTGSAVLLAEMASNLHIDRQQLGLFTGVFMLVTSVTGPLLALAFTKAGAWRMIGMGTAVTVIAALAMALVVTDVVEGVLAYGVLLAVGNSALVTMTSQSIIVRYFSERRALALSILYAGVAAGGLLAVPLFTRLILLTAGNWRAGWWIDAGLTLVIGTGATLFLRLTPSPPDEERPTSALSARAQRAHVAIVEWTSAEARRSGTYWLLVAIYSVGLSGYVVFMAHGIPHLKDVGYSTAQAGWVITGFTAAALVAKLVLAVLGDRYDPRLIWSFVAIGEGTGMVFAVHPQAIWQLAIVSAGIGASGGAVTVAMSATLGNYFGHKAFPALMGLALAVSAACTGLVPFLAGRAFDVTGTYAIPFYAIAACSLIGATILLLLKRPDHKTLCDDASLDALQPNAAGMAHDAPVRPIA